MALPVTHDQLHKYVVTTYMKEMGDSCRVVLDDRGITGRSYHLYADDNVIAVIFLGLSSYMLSISRDCPFLWEERFFLQTPAAYMIKIRLQKKSTCAFCKTSFDYGSLTCKSCDERKSKRFLKKTTWLYVRHLLISKTFPCDLVRTITPFLARLMTPEELR